MKSNWYLPESNRMRANQIRARRSTQACSDTDWHVLRSSARREAVAADSLRSFGIQAIAPRIEEVRHTRHSHNKVIVPMFPNYIFSKIDPEYFKSLGNIHGVESLVSFNGFHPPVEQSFIDKLEERMDSLGVVRLGAGLRLNKLEPGEKIQVTEGPFVGLTGLFQYSLDSDRRVAILMDLLYQTTIQPLVLVDSNQISRINAL